MTVAQSINTLSSKAAAALLQAGANLRTPALKADADAILFSAKSFAAAMLAYYISLRIGLPNVAATFSWVRLAQRIPVRIHIDRVPSGVALAAGMTATVEIIPETAQPGRR